MGSGFGVSVTVDSFGLLTLGFSTSFTIFFGFDCFFSEILSVLKNALIEFKRS